MFLQARSESKLNMSDLESKPEVSSFQPASSAVSYAAPDKMSSSVFPPKHFVESIQDQRLVSSPTSCFVLYGLNSGDLKSDLCESYEVPFELFKECYHKSKSRFDLSKYFNVKRVEIPLAQDVTLEGTTIGELAREEVQIFPNILKFHRMTANLNTEKHLQAHKDKIEGLLQRFLDQKVFNLYINWLKLIESYVELVFRDLLVKWCQWLHTVRSMGHRRSVQTVLRMWLNRLCRQFWSRYFVFDSGQRSSINDIGRRLTRYAQASEWNLHGTSASYGVWLDVKNGVIIFASGLVFEQVKICPTYGACLEQNSPDDITTRLLFYINIAILECFVNEIA